ncbi:hypothetical protein Lesp02_78170 [Lentzea sp. NBRC 105346]|uniref:hypothetical protein n=1 Tax=Lentzea sp. NBRC 105346 TaxID=3032205 RepID=UPI0024A4C54B|nr:hypothetical protein [Lentzea sp. NBRC 105346]GLZ35630.1 hypothetical protein Lesp02_78170 [Lentzea sp. NBRC 105346]
MSGSGRLLLLLLCVETFVLAVLEVFFLPLRFDGTLLPRWGDVQFPITIAMAIVTTPMLVLWAASLGRGLRVAAAPLAVWALTVFVVLFFEPGGGQYMLLDDWRSLMLFAGGALPGAVAVGAVMGRNAQAGIQ